MAELNSVLIQTSRYVSGGTAEVNSSPALEWWERTVFPVNPDDLVYVVDQKFAGRLDLISALYLGEPRYWWVIAQYNNILDPYAEVMTRRVIYIPTIARVNLIMSGKLGGVPSTRTVPLSITPIV